MMDSKIYNLLEQIRQLQAGSGGRGTQIQALNYGGAPDPIMAALAQANNAALVRPPAPGCPGGVCGTGSAAPQTQAQMGGAGAAQWAQLVAQYGADIAAQIIWATRGGTVGQGYPCAPQSLPPLAVDRNGCEQGWKQCKLPIPVNAVNVLPGETVTIDIRPPYNAVADQYIYTGPANAFIIQALRIGLTDFMAPGVPSDLYNGAANSVDYSVDWAPFSSSTPAEMTVTNISPFIQTHRGAVQTRASRQAG